MVFDGFPITRIFVVVIPVARAERDTDRAAIVRKFVFGVLLRFEQRRFALLLLGLGFSLALLGVVKSSGWVLYTRGFRQFMG